jgi:hypothetical protein
MRAGLRLSGNLCRSPPVNRLKAGLANDGARPNRTWTGVKSCPLFRTRRQAHSTAVWLEEGWPRLRAQSHSSRNCLTAYSVSHLSGRFLRLGKSIMGEPKKGRRAKGQLVLSRGGEQTTRYCAPKSSSGYTVENTRFRFAVREYSQTGRQAKPNRLSSRRRLLISSLDRRSAACAGARHTLSRRRCTGVPGSSRQIDINSSPVSDV